MWTTDAIHRFSTEYLQHQQYQHNHHYFQYYTMRRSTSPSSSGSAHFKQGGKYVKNALVAFGRCFTDLNNKQRQIPQSSSIEQQHQDHDDDINLQQNQPLKISTTSITRDDPSKLNSNRNLKRNHTDVHEPASKISQFTARTNTDVQKEPVSSSSILDELPSNFSTVTNEDENNREQQQEEQEKPPPPPPQQQQQQYDTSNINENNDQQQQEQQYSDYNNKDENSYGQRLVRAWYTRHITIQTLFAITVALFVVSTTHSKQPKYNQYNYNNPHDKKYRFIFSKRQFSQSSNQYNDFGEFHRHRQRDRQRHSQKQRRKANYNRRKYHGRRRYHRSSTFLNINACFSPY